MRANEFITELFQPKEKSWEWGFRGSEEAIADFKVGEVPYRFHAYNSGDNNWEVEFKNNTTRDRTTDRTSGWKSRFGLTGTGNSAEVMSTVVDIMREFLQTYHGNIDTIGFTAEEPSRQKLYMRMMKRLLPTWTISTYDAGDGALGFTVVAPDNLSEVFQPGKTNWEWRRRNSEEATAEFRVGDREYRWEAFVHRAANPFKWEIQFKALRQSTDPDKFDIWGMTGTGNAAEVLSTAVDITRAFLQEYGDKVEEITFNSKHGEDSRTSLYAKMIHRLLPDWDFYKRQDPHNGTEFHLTDRKAYDKPENKISEEAKAGKYNGLVMKYAFNNSALIMKAFDNTRTPLAYVKFVKEGDELYPQDLWVHDDHRNRGIAKSMYDFLKNEGYVINRSHDQTKAGSGFWDKHRGEDAYVWEGDEVLDEMPLPADWDPQQMRQQNTTFKSRLAYALERAKKLGTGSSRVATVIEYQGRPTVLKIAKNAKGLAQNSVEADILSDGYASQLGILIPIIDYDEQNREPSWVHTEMAIKSTEKNLARMMGVESLRELVLFANAIAGKSKRMTYDTQVQYMRDHDRTEQQIETATEYANILADLANSFDVELGDFDRAANWGLYNGKPVIVDVGFNSNVLQQYYS